MNLFSLMQQRTAEAGPIRVGVIGAGKFSSMFLTQAVGSSNIHVVGVADINVPKAKDALARTGWPAERYAAASLDDAVRTGGTAVIDDSTALITHPSVEVVLEITGNPLVGTYHAVTAIDHGKHVIMVNVEADCMVGPILQRRAQDAGVVYSMAYGDQPALICELVDWCRTVGFDVVAAGKGTKYLPEYNYSTPDTVWNYYGFTDEQLASGDYNPKMFNSFLDGTKSAIEMAAVANGTGLLPQDEGLLFPAASKDDLPTVFRERSLGGSLSRRGTVEIASSMYRDGREVPDNLRWGVYVTFEAVTDYAVQCFAEYGVHTDETGRYGSLYRPYHMIGLELGVSIAAAVTRGEATGAPTGFRGDVVTTAKRDLRAGDTLDGEGGFTVFGKLAPAATSLERSALPLGLAHGAKLIRDVPKDQIVSWDDVQLDESQFAVQIRRQLEAEFRAEHLAAAAA
ncbi:putative homoserine dehydrogenase-like protein [Agromyces flavus]|uniref:Homoserine dehydrogenase-like protein n=1 Tax=Agromyces flavus TaxID=589382 RepID=A0A1H1VXU8_9MICO|nr:Gfo/Idh/MocA family oxidoreductase [Agromyces flavus]MCP2366037.1 putative homoserine dehydrogenase-like protein [Agromyces flavus]GGI43873.1 flagellar protein FlgA [Agromyces flavus]SDS89583.1 Predicted homoserine dehydrogenase, contains C-terminal SAF domain [Agromyces flavus]